MDKLPPPIGSPEWYLELSVFDVSKSKVELEFQKAVAGRALAKIDPHEFEPEGSTIVKAAVWLLLFPHVSTYGTLMLLGDCVWYADDLNLQISTWLARQFASIFIYGTEDEVAVLSNRLEVDEFEVSERGEIVFLTLVQILPRKDLAKLLPVTGPLRWKLKSDVYHEAAKDPFLHEALAKGLKDSIYGVCGDVEMTEANYLFSKIQIEDPELREDVKEAVSGPQRLFINEVVTQYEITYLLQGIARGNSASYLVEVYYLSKPGVVSKSDLIWDGRIYRKVRHWADTSKSQFKEKLTAVDNPHKDCRHSYWIIDGPVDKAKELVGKEVESWPPGLRDYLKDKVGQKG